MAEGKAIVYPLGFAYVKTPDLIPAERQALAEMLGGTPRRGGIYVPPEEYESSCRVGLLPERACP